MPAGDEIKDQMNMMAHESTMKHKADNLTGRTKEPVFTCPDCRQVADECSCPDANDILARRLLISTIRRSADESMSHFLQIDRNQWNACDAELKRLSTALASAEERAEQFQLRLAGALIAAEGGNGQPPDAINAIQTCPTIRAVTQLRASLSAADSRLGEAVSALEQTTAFIGIMCGRGPDAVIPETINSPIGVPIKIGDIMREARHTLARLSLPTEAKPAKCPRCNDTGMVCESEEAGGVPVPVDRPCDCKPESPRGAEEGAMAAHVPWSINHDGFICDANGVQIDSATRPAQQRAQLMSLIVTAVNDYVGRMADALIRRAGEANAHPTPVPARTGDSQC